MIFNFKIIITLFFATSLYIGLYLNCIKYFNTQSINSPSECLPSLVLPPKVSNDFFEYPKWYQSYSKSQIDFLNKNVFVYARNVENSRDVFFLNLLKPFMVQQYPHHSLLMVMQ